jgi:signal peptidase I
MLPTLNVGDTIVANQWAPYWREPRRGELVVARKQDGEAYTGRVIALPDDTVQMKDGELWLNGAPVLRVRVADTEILVSEYSDCVSPIDAQFRTTNATGQPVCRLPTYRETMPGGHSYLTLDLAQTPQDNTEPLIVPAGRIFLMGDNRDNSEDSRFDAFGGPGLFSRKQITGYLYARLLPVNKSVIE